MAKLSNNVEYVNFYLPVEYAEYLLSNDFTCTKPSTGTLLFTKGNVFLQVKEDTIDMYRFIENIDPDRGQWRFFQSHTGIAQLGLFNWMMLLHIMTVLPIKDFLKNAKSESIPALASAWVMFQQLQHSF